MSDSHNTTKTIAVPLTVSTTAYSANDVVGGLITLNVPSGIVRRVKLTDDDNEGAAMTLYLFDAQPTTIANDAAFAPTISDDDKLVAILTLDTTGYFTLNSNKVGWFKGDDDRIGLDIDYEAKQNKLFAYLVCTGTPTYTAASDLKLHFTLWLDYPRLANV